MPNFDNKGQNKRIAEIRHKEEESFVERIAEKFKLPYIDLSGTPVETDALSVIDESDARHARIAPFKIVGKDLYVAVKSPNLPDTKRVIEKLEKKYNLGVHMASTKSLEKAWDRYQDISKTTESEGGMLDISEAELKKLSENINSNTDIQNEMNAVFADDSQKKTTQIMEIIFAGAIATGSSDVHIEAQDEVVRLRFRQDGVLQDIATMTHEDYKKLLSRIKLISNMKLTQNSNAQDGRFTIDYDGKEIEVRVSVIPSAYGESFVMRILNPDGIKVGLEKLGIEPKLYEILLKEIKKPNGMILTTGPTGSGKTTTLYSFMNKVYNPEVKILTIEDPIEYHLDGISQTQVNRSRGYDFLSGLRAALRQDPDIVMVGEIRDAETASIAVNASLTGHLVLSTLHTNGAAGVIPRLIDLGVSPQILAAALTVSLAQRLVRKVCENCHKKRPATEEEQMTLRSVLRRAENNSKPLHEYGVSSDQEITLAEPVGCEVCNQTGYKGRMGIFEAIITDESIEELLNKNPSEQDVRRVAEKQGLLNMAEDGVIKIVNQITTLEEVAKVVDLEIKEASSTQAKKEASLAEKNSAKETQNNDKHQDQPESIIAPQKMNPDALMSTKSVEISLLVDYLKRLEHDQAVNPENNVTDDIKKVQNTILHLLKSQNAPEVFEEDNNFAQTHKHFKDLHAHAETLHQQQSDDSSASAEKGLRRIREGVEYHDILSKEKTA